MIDVFTFQAPLGVLGRLAETLFLTRYVKNLLLSRNRYLKQVAESETEPSPLSRSWHPAHQRMHGASDLMGYLLAATSPPTSLPQGEESQSYHVGCSSRRLSPLLAACRRFSPLLARGELRSDSPLPLAGEEQWVRSYLTPHSTPHPTGRTGLSRQPVFGDLSAHCPGRAAPLPPLYALACVY
jgi:hypothetical protein